MSKKIKNILEHCQAKVGTLRKKKPTKTIANQIVERANAKMQAESQTVQKRSSKIKKQNIKAKGNKRTKATKRTGKIKAKLNAIKSSEAKTKAQQLLWCCFGSILYALGVNLFLSPANLYAGGVTGISQLIINTFGLTYPGINLEGILYFILNMPIFVYAYKIFGPKFLGKSLFCIIVDTITLTLIPIPEVPIVSDLLTTCLMGGVLTGIGAAFVVSHGISAGGGTDLLGMAVSKNHKISVGKLALIINMFIYAASGVLYSIETALYSFIVSLVCSIVVDKMHKQNRNVAVNVLTKKPDVVVKLIFDTISRGATILNGRGGYSGEKTDMVVTIMSETEYEQFDKLIKTVDENAFVFVQSEVLINGAYEKRLL